MIGTRESDDKSVEQYHLEIELLKRIQFGLFWWKIIPLWLEYVRLDMRQPSLIIVNFVFMFEQQQIHSYNISCCFISPSPSKCNMLVRW